MGRIAFLVISASLVLAGCARPQPRTPEAVVAKAAAKKEPSFFDDLELTSAQRKRVGEIVDGLYEAFADYDEKRIVLLDLVIAQVRKGELDREELLPIAEETVASFEEAMPAALRAMEEMHDVLNQAQREELVKLFSEGRELSPEERRAAREERIGKVLDLTAGQKAKLYPSLLALYIRNWGVVGDFRGAIDEALDAFEAEDLKVDELAIAQDLKLMPIGEVIFEALEMSMGILTEEQQETLAAYVDASLRSPNPTK
jgi:Spy/CpxP family protein refolding chaperone